MRICLLRMVLLVLLIANTEISFAGAVCSSESAVTGSESRVVRPTRLNTALYNTACSLDATELDEETITRVLEPLSQLLDSGADPNYAPLWQEDLLSQLIASGADPNYVPLWRTLQLHPRVVRRLVERGADGLGPLISAVVLDNREMMGVLLGDCKDNPSKKERYKSALLHAIQKSKVSAARLLFEAQVEFGKDWWLQIKCKEVRDLWDYYCPNTVLPKW